VFDKVGADMNVIFVCGYRRVDLVLLRVKFFLNQANITPICFKCFKVTYEFGPGFLSRLVLSLVTLFGEI
jgi:hypothetical protein